MTDEPDGHEVLHRWHHVLKFSQTLPVSQEVVDDWQGRTIIAALHREIGDQIVLGRSRRNVNPLPEFVFFPRLQRVLDVIADLYRRTSDAVSAFRYGIPEDGA